MKEVAFSVSPLLHDWLCPLAISQNSSFASLLFPSLNPRAPPREIFKFFMASVWDLFCRPSIRLFTRTANCLHSPMTCFSMFNSRALAKILSTPSLIGNRVKYLTSLMLEPKSLSLKLQVPLDTSCLFWPSEARRSYCGRREEDRT